MSTLHTVNKSPFERNSLTRCLRPSLAGDAVLMIEDGVLGARKGGAFARPLIEGALRRSDLRAWAGPRRARHEAEDLAEGSASSITSGFVDLAATHARVCAWL